MTATEAAKAIRTELKREHGWTGRDVSVRADYYSMGSAVRVKVRNPDVDFATVRRIAEGYARVRRCEYTHEILGGGNMYVTVSISREAEDALAARFEDAVAAAMSNFTEGERSSSLYPVEGSNALVGSGQYGDALTVWIEGRRVEQFWWSDHRGAAVYIATHDGNDD